MRSYVRFLKRLQYNQSLQSKKKHITNSQNMILLTINEWFTGNGVAKIFSVKESQYENKKGKCLKLAIQKKFKRAITGQSMHCIAPKYKALYQSWEGWISCILLYDVKFLLQQKIDFHRNGLSTYITLTPQIGYQ